MDSRCTTNKQCCIYYRYNSDAERENYEESLRREACGWIGGDVHVFCDEGNDTASLNLLMRCVMARRVSVLITISLDMLGNDPLIVKNHVLTLVFMRVELIVKSTKICFSAEEILLRSIIAYNSFGSQWINEYGYYFEHRILFMRETAHLDICAALMARRQLMKRKRMLSEGYSKCAPMG